MAKVVVMPKLGLTMTEGTLSAWKKKEGDAVKEGEALFEVETDKLTNTIEAPASGVLRRIIVAEGRTVPCLEPVAVIAAADEDITGSGACGRCGQDAGRAPDRVSGGKKAREGAGHRYCPRQRHRPEGQSDRGGREKL